MSTDQLSQPEYKSIWNIKDIDKTDVQSHVQITVPSGFKITVNNPYGVIDLLGHLANRGDIIQPGDGSILNLTPEGCITLIDCDKWDNPGFEFGQLIANVSGLAYCLVKYLKDKIPKPERL